MNTFPLLPGTKPVTPVCFCRCRSCSSGEAKMWTVAMSPCLCSWQSSSQPPLSLPQEMSFSNSVSNALNFSLLPSYKIKRKRDQLLAMASTSRAFSVFLHLFFSTLLHILRRQHQHLSNAALKMRPLSKICKVMLRAALALHR